ncbi:ATP-binding protein [Vibrio crassostreae]|uniref:NACHT domain-containing protein n=1 Tax=Vibrio crassostreae TaxID=246167 RepID=UPI0010446EE7|nr:hypothetical protein [Vibrio crassostreae]TCN82856.1 hypothetical protein EDB37_10207 [Vibrio crassostreae]CAK2397585.1 ATP-binding protein [Vibrio crassostreae]CAK2440583.1 ATP-binding protein [Vibrio crassostreae]CAK3566418.1 ATP-binding protein [Vibrio crassostreae]CAK3842431.1 ATP-binding protein [Vibrio crassostreae]
MCLQFYLQRRLSSETKTFSESELLATSKCIVVLAEPGGGKTELLKSLGQQLGTSSITANIFVHLGANNYNTPIVIDAFDELAKIEQSGIHRLLAQIRHAEPTHVIISSRSSEWDNAATNTVQDFLNTEPLVVRLCEFDELEQRAIFEHYAPSEDFAVFNSEVSKFALEALLPNPQFLKMFIDAYLESGRSFADKQSIFKLAVERLAKEVSKTAGRANQVLSTTQKVDISSEIFAKLLLSGAEGVSISEIAADRIHPLLTSLVGNNSSIYSVLTTRLFKLGSNSDQHLPVHKIVAEYCAAKYITKRILDPTDPITLNQCLPIIAPNSTVRDELRGLLGWIATLGNKSVQEAAIELDPYAVLANGDPSQLEPSSKLLLLSKLKEVESKDPYFRRSDFSRRFSLAGFFTEDIVEDIKPLLKKPSDGHLRELVLELLIGAPINQLLQDQLRQIVLEPKEDKYSRIFAFNSLLSSPYYQLEPDLVLLLSEASSVSLQVAAKGIESINSSPLELELCKQFFLACSNLYPNDRHRMERVIGERYFIKSLIKTLQKEAVEWLLDTLTKDLVCTCGLEVYECNCRNGMSKIISMILDHYFNITTPPYDPLRIWRWLNNLNFHRSIDPKQSKSVQVLLENNELRQGILTHVFGGLTKRDQILKTRVHKFGCQSHSGLQLYIQDHKFLVNLGFNTNNPDLWVSFIAMHNRHQKAEERGPNELRSHMRLQAKSNPIFMQVWAESNKAAELISQDYYERWGSRRGRAMKRYKKRKMNAQKKNINYIKNNRKLIESGKHLGFLARFSEVLLECPEDIALEFGDEKIVSNALINCIDSIGLKVPSLKKIGELHGSSQRLTIETILVASSIEVMRKHANLGMFKPELLFALKTSSNIHYSAIDESEHKALHKEVDRLLFTDTDSAESFLRQYVEPQLATIDCEYPKVDMLSYDEVFSPLKAKLSIEWLERFEELSIHTLSTLFSIAAEFGDRKRLKQVILTRCSALSPFLPLLTSDEKIKAKRNFWFVRAFYFLDLGVCRPYFDWLKADKKSLLLFADHSGHTTRGDSVCWPSLTSPKIELILDSFFNQWPKVHLPSCWGTGSPEGETAYRFLTNIIWFIGNDTPDEAICVLERLINKEQFSDMRQPLKSMEAEQLRKKALGNFVPPKPEQIVDLLDNNAVVTVEGLRQLVLQTLHDYQKDIDGGEFNAATRFYTKDNNGNDVHRNEVSCVEIIAERLNLLLHPQNITISAEYQTKNQNRIDITVAKHIDGKRRLLVIEAKGQWHKDLYYSASTQLYERYSIHPDADQQGMYLLIWFGPHIAVAGRKNLKINSANDLKLEVEQRLPASLNGRIDVFVLDVSRS